MKGVISLVLLIAILGLTGCGGPDLCEEPEFYEFAEVGKRIDTPDDLSELSADRELVIPDPSPRPPREPGSGCLDRPPTLRTGGDESES